MGAAPVARAGANLVADRYDIQIKFEHHLQQGTRYDLEAVEVAPAVPEVDVLIGRDVLEKVSILYDGPNQKLALMY